MYLTVRSFQVNLKGLSKNFSVLQKVRRSPTLDHRNYYPNAILQKNNNKKKKFGLERNDSYFEKARDFHQTLSRK